MDFSYTPEQEAFRKEVRAMAGGPICRRNCVSTTPPTSGSRPIAKSSRSGAPGRRRLFEAGWVGIAWPRKFGGRGASVIEQVIYNEEYGRARAPMLPGYSGVGMCGPTIAQWGTEEQRQRFLKRILSGEDIWCQGYSEPNAGSDLAGIQTRAEDKGDYFVLNGQKIWTSGAQYADWMFLLARSDPAAPKHLGISYLLLDMRTKGIEVRPLVTASGHAHFNEVFFEDVQVPKENLVGPKNEGWKVAMTTLSFERGAAGGGYDSQIRALVDLARSLSYRRAAGLGARLGAPADRASLDRIQGREICAPAIPDAPAQRPAAGAGRLDAEAVRIGAGNADRDFSSPSCWVRTGRSAQPMAELPDAPRWQNRIISSRQYTIAGGTSEIQRNIIGERTLKLPK